MWACFLVSDLKLPDVCMAHPLTLFIAPVGSGEWLPLCVYLNALLILHFLWLEQSYMHVQKCPAGFTLSPDGAALCSGTIVPYQLHTFCRWSSPLHAQQHPVVSAGSISRFQGPVCACYVTPLFLLELALEGVAGDMLHYPWRSARVPG